jgi:hypothetical protein
LALTITEVLRSVIGNRRIVVKQIVDDGSGGAVDTGLSGIDSAMVVNETSGARTPGLSIASGVVTLGAEGNSNDIHLLTVIGL